MILSSRFLKIYIFNIQAFYAEIPYSNLPFFALNSYLYKQVQIVEYVAARKHSMYNNFDWLEIHPKMAQLYPQLTNWLENGREKLLGLDYGY